MAAVAGAAVGNRPTACIPSRARRCSTLFRRGRSSAW
nr:MAG TPA: hypothetical protein [Caudoviricetes sp.]